MSKRILFWFLLIFLSSYSYSYSSSYSDSLPLHAPKSASFSYDSNGNLLKSTNGNILVYNQDNRLVEVKDNTGKTIQKNTYDYTGQRIKKVDYNPSGTVTTYYHIPGIEIEISTTNTQPLTTITRYLPNGVIQKLSSGENKIYQTYQDHLSSVKVITDDQGNKIEDYDYYPYGEELGVRKLGVTSRLYTNQIKDNTGLYYYNQRYYDPALGIFTSPDQAQGPNRYLYVGGNPIMRNDPSGNDPDSPLSQWRGRYKSPLPNFDPRGVSWNHDIRIFLTKSLILTSGTLGVGTLAGSEYFTGKYINLEMLRNPAYQNLEESIWKATNFEAATDLEFITSLTKAVYQQVEINGKFVTLLYESPSFTESLKLIPRTAVDQLNPNLLKSIVGGTSTCQHLAPYLNYLLGTQGINSVVHTTPLHAYLRININGVIYAADPTNNIVAPVEEFMNMEVSQNKLINTLVKTSMMFPYSPDEINKGTSTFYRNSGEIEYLKMLHLQGLYKAIFNQPFPEGKMSDMYAK